MMGKSHAFAGAVVGLFVAPQFSHGVLPLVAGVAVTAGAGVWPDSDQPQASVARSFYWPGQIVGTVVGRVSGGHRHATHSLLAALAAGVIAYTVGMSSVGRLALMFLMVAPAIHVGILAWKAEAPMWLGLIGLTGSGLLAWSWAPYTSPLLLAACITAGWLTHLVCDALTVGGVPLLWPWAKWMSLPVLGRTGGVGERLVAMPVLFLLGLYGLVQVVRL